MNQTTKQQRQALALTLYTSTKSALTRLHRPRPKGREGRVAAAQHAARAIGANRSRRSSREAADEAVRAARRRRRREYVSKSAKPLEKRLHRFKEKRHQEFVDRFLATVRKESSYRSNGVYTRWELSPSSAVSLTCRAETKWHPKKTQSWIEATYAIGGSLETWLGIARQLKQKHPVLDVKKSRFQTVGLVCYGLKQDKTGQWWARVTTQGRGYEDLYREWILAEKDFEGQWVGKFTKRSPKWAEGDGPLAGWYYVDEKASKEEVAA